MVRNSILIFCVCVCFLSVSYIRISIHSFLHSYNKQITSCWFVCTIFITHSLWRIAKLTRSLRSLVRLMILHNSWIKIVRTHQPWSNLYILIKQLDCSLSMNLASLGFYLHTTLQKGPWPHGLITWIPKKLGGLLMSSFCCWERSCWGVFVLLVCKKCNVCYWHENDNCICVAAKMTV